jgi:DhnA family fructose-bisphosphate aldolase class Ia
MKYRMNRLFNAESNRCINVAIDHGFFGQGALLKSIENIEQAVKTVVQAGPDVIQLTVGQARYLQSMPGKEKPVLALRTDVANIYGKTLPKTRLSRMIECPVEQALRLDAACVVVNLFEIPNASDVTDQCIQNILKIKPECDRYAMPLMVEPLVFQPNEKAGGYMVNGDLERIVPLVRQAVELGSDIIKADPTYDVNDYHHVVETAGRVPVLVRGGGKVPDREILKRTEGLIRQGACGIVYGRNIIQHENPLGITQALKAVVHQGKSAEAAMACLKDGVLV